MHYHDDEYALTCGDKFDDTVEESEEALKKQGEEGPAVSEDSNTVGLNQKEKRDIKQSRS